MKIPGPRARTNREPTISVLISQVSRIVGRDRDYPQDDGLRQKRKRQGVDPRRLFSPILVLRLAD
jgi:hypothetical protein